MNSPLENFLVWFNSLPSSHRQDIAMIIVSTMPGFTTVYSLERLEELESDFINYVKSVSGSHHTEVGVVLALTASIDFFIASKRSDAKKSTDNGEHFYQLMYEKTASDQWLQKKEEAQFAAKAWEKSCKKWKDIKDTKLSYEILNAYLK